MVANGQSLDGRTVYVPRMCHGGSELIAAAFRGIGVDAAACPEPGERAVETARRYTSGDECYPQVVTLAGFLQVMEQPGFEPGATAFVMPTTSGPCRFGQYAPLLERILRNLGCPEVVLVSPSTDTGYREVAEHATALKRLLWWGLVASDMLRGMLHRTRPYEVRPGSADQAHEESLAEVSAALGKPGPADREKLETMAQALVRSRDRLRAVETDPSADRLLIGMVGEIFCRLSTFSNDDLARRVEQVGGEVWLSGMTEWVWYVNLWEKQELKDDGRSLSTAMLGTWLTERVQRKDEEQLIALFHEDFVGREDPHCVEEVLELAQPYLPWKGALGEMVLSVGKAVYVQRKGAHGVIDVSPFSCMNGIVSESVYPAASRDNGGMPIRSLYFDGSVYDVQTDLEIFMELAANYRRGQNAAWRRGPKALQRLAV
jgi:predicted nucleotide-binding protein (sugar kinase/HSP70/actin superfamily)